MKTLIVDCANEFFSFRHCKYRYFKTDRFRPYILNNFLKDYKVWMDELIESNKNIYLIFVQKFHSIEILNKEFLEEFSGRCRFLYIGIDWARIDNLRVSDMEMKMIKQYDDFVCINIQKRVKNSEILSRDKFRDFQKVSFFLEYLNVKIFKIFDICEEE